MAVGDTLWGGGGRIREAQKVGHPQMPTDPLEKGANPFPPPASAKYFFVFKGFLVGDVFFFSFEKNFARLKKK